MASPSSQSPKVIIVGAGIAGPILAIFLKLSGYSPVIYERQSQSAPGGICLTLQPNGLRVLEMIPGLLPKISGAIVDSLQFYSVEPSDPGLLAHSQIIADLVKEGQLRYPWTTVNRGQFHDLILAEATEVYGVPIFYDHSVVDVVENEEEGSVSVRFADGRSDSAAFVVGCDGLHSNTRVALFGREKADFTGMTQMGGMSPFPVDETLRRGMTNLYGDGLHFLSYPTSDETICWIITQHENEAKETWKPMDDAGQEEVRRGPYSQLPYGAGELVKTCKQIVKYGLYDRPELKSWYRGRVVLLGDAAHPTSPHLGQGANQSFEDVYHLVRLLNKHNGGTSTNFMQQDVAKAVYPPVPSIGTLTTVFEEYTNKRLARTSALTKGARMQGELRLVHGVDASLARNEKVRAIWKNEGAMVKGYMEVWKGTFEDEDGANADQSLVDMSNHQ